MASPIEAFKSLPPHRVKFGIIGVGAAGVFVFVKKWKAAKAANASTSPSTMTVGTAPANSGGIPGFDNGGSGGGIGSVIGSGSGNPPSATQGPNPPQGVLDSSGHRIPAPSLPPAASAAIQQANSIKQETIASQAANPKNALSVITPDFISTPGIGPNGGAGYYNVSPDSAAGKMLRDLGTQQGSGLNLQQLAQASGQGVNMDLALTPQQVAISDAAQRGITNEQLWAQYHDLSKDPYNNQYGPASAMAQ